MIDDYREVLERESSVRSGNTLYQHSLGAYAIHPGAGLPALDDLLQAQRLLQDPALASGPARQILTLIGQSPEQAKIRYRRWHSLHSTAVDRDSGTALNRSLRGMEVIIPLTLEAIISPLPGQQPGDAWPELVRRALPLLQGLGAHRNRGLGRVQVSLLTMPAASTESAR
jgi:hypothetical protein